MKTVAVVCNAVLLAFTGVVLVTDGWSSEPPYVALTFFLLLAPVVSSAVFLAGRRRDGWLALSPVPRLVAIGCNAALLAFSCWALVDSYPHPEESGYFAFVAVVLLVPVVSLAVLLHGAPRTQAQAG